MEQISVYEILTELGYQLKDYGKEFRAKPLYRDSDNDTVLRIYKDTGKWFDFKQNISGDINSLVDRIVLEDAFDKVLISGGRLLATGKYLWRITVPPSALRPNNTVVLQRVGSDTDIPATITINAPTTNFDYNNIERGMGAWVKRIVNTPPQYVVVPP